MRTKKPVIDERAVRVDAQWDLNRSVVSIRTLLGASEVRIVCDATPYVPMTIGPGPWSITALVNGEERRLATSMDTLPGAIGCAEHAVTQALAAARLELAETNGTT